MPTPCSTQPDPAVSVEAQRHVARMNSLGNAGSTQPSAQTSVIRAPKEPPRRKARTAAECEQLEQLPNIGPSLAGDLRSLGIQHPTELASRDAFDLYRALCTLTAKRHDPCVLDTFIAATAFMRGSDAKPWWAYTAQRKLDHPGI